MNDVNLERLARHYLEIEEQKLDPYEALVAARRLAEAVVVQTKLVARVKIMLWAIEKCGGAEPATEAFERAVRSLEQGG